MQVTQETQHVAQQALDYIIEHPERHDQTSFFCLGGTDTFDETYLAADANICDTTMCIAGTVQWQQAGHIDTSNVSQYAAEKLGLQGSEANRLFHQYNNDKAIDLLTAIANGDEVKFYSLAYM